MSSVTASSVLKRDGNTALVSQTASGHFLFFSRDINLVLKVQEFPTERLLFEDISAKSFRVYHGSWSLEPAPEGVRVNYQLEVNQAAFGPAWIEKSLFQDNALGLMRELKSEIVRRAGTRLAALNTAPAEKNQR